MKKIRNMGTPHAGDGVDLIYLGSILIWQPFSYKLEGIYGYDKDFDINQLFSQLNILVRLQK